LSLAACGGGGGDGVSAAGMPPGAVGVQGNLVGQPAPAVSSSRQVALAGDTGHDYVQDTSSMISAAKTGRGMPAVIPLVPKDSAGNEYPLDVVCGMRVEPKYAALGYKSEYMGQTYLFCSDYCKKQFDHRPERFAKTPPGDTGQPTGQSLPETMAHSHGRAVAFN